MKEEELSDLVWLDRRLDNMLSRFAAWCLLFCLADISSLR
jgi:hypothetical protein